MTNKQKIKELQDRINTLEVEHKAIQLWLIQKSDFSSAIEEAVKKKIGGMSKEQVQDLIYKLTLIAYKADGRKGDISCCVAELIKFIADKASVQNEQTESEETKNECSI